MWARSGVVDAKNVAYDWRTTEVCKSSMVRIHTYTTFHVSILFVARITIAVRANWSLLASHFTAERSIRAFIASYIRWRKKLSKYEEKNEALGTDA
jgi:hypothetical protein